MSILSKINILFVIIMSILLLSVFDQQELKQSDDLCPEIISVFCVKDVLSKISSAVERINGIAEEIQEYVVNKIKTFFKWLIHIFQETNEPTRIMFNKYIDEKMKHIRSDLSSKYHSFMNTSININRVCASELNNSTFLLFSI